MYLFVLGGIVIAGCLIYIFAVDHPEFFVGKKTRRQPERKADDEKDTPKVIYLPESPDDLEAEKARRHNKDRRKR